MGDNSSSQPTNQTVTQTSIPKEFYPYLTNIMGSAQAVASRPYEAYQGPRLSDFSTDTKQAFDMNRQNAGAWQPYYDQAQSSVGAGMNMAQNALSGAYQSVSAPQGVSTGQWNGQAAQQYMSPYIGSVLNSALGQMNKAYGVDQANIAQKAEGAGAYGGGRMAVAQQEAFNNQALNYQNLVSNTLNQGYTNAQSIFGQDQSRSLQAQQFNNTQDLQAQMANQQAALQYGQLGLQGAQQLGALGGQMAGLGSSSQALANSDADRLRNQGLAQEQLNQASMDLGYQQFQDQQNYDKNNLAWESGLLHGLPVGQNQIQSTTDTTNPFSQMVGAGLGLAGLSKTLGA